MTVPMVMIGSGRAVLNPLSEYVQALAMVDFRLVLADTRSCARIHGP